MKPFKAILVLSAAIAVFSFRSPSNPDSCPANFGERIDSIFAEYDSTGKPGAAISVIHNGKVVFEKGYGSANLEYDIPVTSSTVFHVASLSKQFTVFSLLLLADEGKLSFDDDVRKFIPEFPDFGKTITLRHLASHTSGLRDQWSLLAMAGWRLDDVITDKQVLKLITKQNELNFEPGEEFLYCNTGYTLLAEVVARVSGMTFAEFTKLRIFDPLRMSNTLFYDDHEKIVKNRAYSYYSDGSVYKKSVLNFGTVGPSSLFTTVTDLSRWALNFESARIGNPKILDEMNTLAKLNNGKTFGGAYGQFVNDYKGLQQIQHSGADAGYRTYFTRFPRQHFAVMIFSNYAGSNTEELALKVSEVFLKDEMHEESNTINEKGDFISLTKEALQEFVGNYWNDIGLYSRKIYIENDTLRYSRGKNNVSPLVPLDQNTFQMLNTAADVKVSFQKEEGKKIMIVTSDIGSPIILENYIRANYSNQELQEFTGTFYSEELSTSYTLCIKNDTLVAAHSRLEDIKISPIKKDFFSGNKWFFGPIAFERSSSNAITGFRVSSGRVRNLYFRKTGSH